jgi:hypothetical protein
MISMHRGDLNNKQLQPGRFASAIPLALALLALALDRDLDRLSAFDLVVGKRILVSSCLFSS